MGYPPWLMWGTTAPVTINGPNARSGQLARINYARPETWSFFFAAELVGVNAAPAADVFFQVAFDIMPGVGRAAFDTQNTQALATPPQDLTFALFQFKLPAGTLPGGNIVTKRWTSTVRSPLLDDNDATSRFDIDHIVAQDIQCQASIVQSTGGPNVQAQFNVSAFFAPRAHVRPEWFSAAPNDGARYRGGENKGL